ncbi:MAG: hypothetical protein KDD60_10655, partial [Bdellovibrionales bacterium]|nr:hypothetical protein [Bdellovibrionales bacterium]
VVESTGNDPAREVSVELGLDHKSYTNFLAAELSNGEKASTNFQVSLPTTTGTYPLQTTVRYQNDGQTLSIVDVGTFSIGPLNLLPSTIHLPPIRIRNEEELLVRYDTSLPLRLIVPEGLKVVATKDTSDGKRFRLQNLLPEFNLHFPIFAVIETIDASGRMALTLQKGSATTRRVVKESSKIPPYFFSCAALLSLVLLLYLFRKLPDDDTLSRLDVCLRRYLFGVFISSVLFLLFRTGYRLADILLPLLDFFPTQHWIAREFEALLRAIIETLYFDGNNYDYFAQYIADPLYLYLLTLNFPVLYYVIRPSPESDKYWHLLRAVVSRIQRALPFITHGTPRSFWSPRCKIAILAILVKAFYLPLLCSWTINNIFHQQFLTDKLANRWTEQAMHFRDVHEYLMALLLLIDVSIFAVGYLTELPPLKNQIRSVEPTLLGWVVCIICYPPFNRVFDSVRGSLFSKWEPASETWQQFALVVVLLLWCIYVWASIALGWKASNLTNRGIVHHGPYRFIRHPAYAAKVSLWAVECWFLSLRSF